MARPGVLPVRLLKRLEIAPGFWVLVAAVWCLEPGLFFPTLLAALIHELGHCAVLAALGAPPVSLRLSALGAELRCGRPLSYAQELPAALAGPAASFLWALAAARAGQFLWAGLSLALGLFNLLPISPLDGGRAAGCLCALLLPPPLDRKAPPWLSLAAAGALLGGAVGMVLGGNGPALLIPAVWLCFQSGKELLEL